MTMRFLIFISPFVCIVGKRYYSTKLNVKSKISYMRIVHEKDNGLNTTNVHILARRHMLSGMPTNVTIINAVLGLSLTQVQLDILTAIKPLECILCNDIKQVRSAIQAIVGKRKKDNKNCHFYRIAGVYVFTNGKSGEQYIGSSLSLAERLITYLTRKNIVEGIRQIFVDFRNFTLSDYKLEIYIIQNGYTITDRAKLLIITLALEQYLIFTLNSKLNTLKVAGSAPYFDGIITPKKQSMHKKQNKTVYVYINDILIYVASSGVQLTSVSGISPNSIWKGISGSLIYGVLKLSRIRNHNSPENLLTPIEFKDVVSDLRLTSKRDIVTIALTEKNKIAVMATNIITGQQHTASSIRDISKLLTTLGPEQSLSRTTIERCLRNGKGSKC